MSESPTAAAAYARLFAERRLCEPPGLVSHVTAPGARSLEPYIYWPERSADQRNSLAYAETLLQSAYSSPPDYLLPLLPVDDESLACVVCRPLTEGPDVCAVVRWHLADIPDDCQGAVLDSDAAAYVQSVAEELSDRPRGLANVKRAAEHYHAEFTAKHRRPKGTDLRPVQLACQNVVVGLALLKHDPTCDGLRVQAYATCEAPHLATHEPDRAMAAMLLCDAFQNGGTMEVRFGVRGDEEPVPAALRRLARSLGLALGVEDPHAITPSEARDFFLAVTPIPDDLRARSLDVMDRGAVSPERLCFTILSSVWSAIELDYILAVSSRSVSILEGGADVERRRARLAELEVCRAATMGGMLHRRLNGTDAAAAHGPVRVFEDASAGVRWSVLEKAGAILMAGVRPGQVPWAPPGQEPILVGEEGLLLAVPRGLPTPTDARSVAELQAQLPAAAVALVVPADMAEVVPPGVAFLLCPDRLGELDTAIEGRLSRSRVGRQ